MNEVQLLHEALNLIYYYNHGGEQVQETLKKKGYNGRPIYYFFPVLIRYSPEFANYYQKTFHAPATSIQSQIKTYVKKMLKQKTSEEDLDVIDIFLAKCYKDQTNYNKLWQITQPRGMFSANEMSQLEKYSQTPTGKGAEIILASLLRGGQGGYGEGGATQAEPTISDLVAKITDAEKITEEDKKKAAEILNNKIKLHENDIKDPKLHAELVKKGHLTQAELDSILELNKADFKTAEEKEKATLDAAERLLRGEIAKREALKTQTPQITEVSTPPIHISSIHVPQAIEGALRTGTSKAQIATGKFLKVSLPKALSGTGGGILKGLGLGAKAAAGLGGKAALLATGVGAPIAAILMVPTAIKAGMKLAKYAAIIVGAILFYFLFNDVNTTGSLFSPGSIGEASVLPPGSNGDISSCIFTRNGTSAPYKSSILLNWLSDAASIANIPPAILASIARHESPELTTNGLDTNDSIINNNYCNPGSAFCEQSGQLLHSGECTDEEKNLGARTGKAMGLMQVVDIYNSGVDLCDIKANIETGTQILKSKLTEGEINEQSVKKAVCRYFGVDSDTCPYGGGDYAQEVWTDYQNCKPTNNYTASCPVKNPTITCGTAKNPHNGCGHGGVGYPEICDPSKYECIGNQYSDLLKSAIDITSTDGKVYFPTVNGEKLNWQKKQTLTLYDNWGIKVLYIATTADGHEITLNFTHLNNTPTPKENGMSGDDTGATLAPGAPGGPHLHLAMMIDGKAIDAIDANLCQ